MNFQVAGTSMLSYDLKNDSVFVENALLAVETYGSSSGTTSQGYTIVFDKTASWSGTGVVSTPVYEPMSDPTPSTSSTTSMGTIIAVSSGGLLIAFAVLFLSNTADDNNTNVNRNSWMVPTMHNSSYSMALVQEANMYDGNADHRGYVKYDIQGYIQNEQGYALTIHKDTGTSTNIHHRPSYHLHLFQPRRCG
ncbi:hypothetical protein BG015_002054 [Linnemannia schmuckeri]|uniref:Uncharacterized protein n=1 Tax=Linnemannia schmuckeri TaxID=64567 RepID=A0A9P5RRQ5_9FUNG|nr:hypothetical protein BG015_002054 [Linnemannia schmuckeri]